MNPAEFEALSAVFPLLLLVALVNGRDVVKDYRGDVYRAVVGLATASNFVGLICSILGIQEGGPVWSVGCWVCLSASVISAGILVLFLAASLDRKDSVGPHDLMSRLFDRLARR